MATIKYWNGSAWELAIVGKQGPAGPTGPTGPAGSASLQRFRFVATGGETSLSGTDANGNTLAYTAGLEEVFLNGSALVRGQDYTATNGTSITGLTALVASDVVEILAWGVFNVSNTISNTLIDAKGDILAGSAADTVSRLAVGADNTVLTADSSTATGLKWAAAGGGKVLQVVQGTTTTSTTIATTSWTSTSLSASITPSATTSKILILTSQPCLVSRSSNQMGGGIRLVRGSTHIFGDNTSSAPNRNFYWTFVGVTDMQVQTQFNLSYLDSPSTTSSTTYTVEGAYNSAGAMTFQNSSQTGAIILMEIGA